MSRRHSNKVIKYNFHGYFSNPKYFTLNINKKNNNTVHGMNRVISFILK